jgi:hypothetical protein
LRSKKTEGVKTASSYQPSTKVTPKTTPQSAVADSSPDKGRCGFVQALRFSSSSEGKSIIKTIPASRPSRQKEQYRQIAQKTIRLFVKHNKFGCDRLKPLPIFILLC